MGYELRKVPSFSALVHQQLVCGVHVKMDDACVMAQGLGITAKSRKLFELCNDIQMVMFAIGKHERIELLWHAFKEVPEEVPVVVSL